MSARAEASERLSEEIVESLSSGLLVVDSDGRRFASSIQPRAVS